MNQFNKDIRKYTIILLFCAYHDTKYELYLIRYEQNQHSWRNIYEKISRNRYSSDVGFPTDGVWKPVIIKF